MGMTEAGPTTPAHFKSPPSIIPITSLLSKQLTWPSPNSRCMWGVEGGDHTLRLWEELPWNKVKLEEVKNRSQ